MKGRFSNKKPFSEWLKVVFLSQSGERRGNAKTLKKFYRKPRKIV